MSKYIFIYRFDNSKKNTIAYLILEITASITQNLRLRIANFLPPVVVMAMLLLRKPTVMSILMGIGMGMVVSLLFQKNSLGSTIEAMWSGVSVTEQNDFVNGSI